MNFQGILSANRQAKSLLDHIDSFKNKREWSEGNHIILAVTSLVDFNLQSHLVFLLFIFSCVFPYKKIIILTKKNRLSVFNSNPKQMGNRVVEPDNPIINKLLRYNDGFSITHVKPTKIKPKVTLISYCYMFFWRP